MTAAMALSASLPRPSASRHSDRYCSTDLRSGAEASGACRSFNTASASSYRADAYRSRAAPSGSRAAVCANADSTNASDVASSSGMISRRAGSAMTLLLLHVHTHANGGVQRDRHRLALLTELRMPKDHFVGTDGDRKIADRRFADALAVDEDLGPRRGVEVDDARRHVDRHGRDLA